MYDVWKYKVEKKIELTTRNKRLVLMDTALYKYFVKARSTDKKE